MPAGWERGVVHGDINVVAIHVRIVFPHTPEDDGLQVGEFPGPGGHAEQAVPWYPCWLSFTRFIEIQSPWLPHSPV